MKKILWVAVGVGVLVVATALVVQVARERELRGTIAPETPLGGSYSQARKFALELERTVGSGSTDCNDYPNYGGDRAGSAPALPIAGLPTFALKDCPKGHAISYGLGDSEVGITRTIFPSDLLKELKDAAAKGQL